MVSFFSYYIYMNLVVPPLDNIFYVLLISALGNFKIGATKLFLNLDFGSPWGEGFLSLYSSSPKLK